MKETVLSLMTAVLVLGLVGCAPAASADEVRSSAPRETPDTLSATDLTQLARGNTEFAFNLFREVQTDSGNLFFSPYSISMALAMTYAGAHGETAQVMAEAMHYLLPSDRLHPAFNYVDRQLASRGEGAQGKDEDGFRLNVVNALWGQKDYEFLSHYLDVLARNYGAGLRVVDFKSQPEPSRAAINQWVEDQTESRIKDLLPEGTITPLTRLVLTNAVYFNAAWHSQFEKSATAPGQFHLLDGSATSVPMMRQTAHFGYYQSDDLEAIDLHYDGGELSMLILLPAEGRFHDFERSVDGATLSQVLDGLQSTRLSLTMPKFKMETSFSLKDALVSMGMVKAFAPGEADFSGLDGTRELYIGDVVHKAFVEVDEAGTEAAAATAVVMQTTAMPADPIEVNIDRPFIFLIRDIETGTVLFLGCVANPAS